MISVIVSISVLSLFNYLICNRFILLHLLVITMNPFKQKENLPFLSQPHTYILTNRDLSKSINHNSPDIVLSGGSNFVLSCQVEGDGQVTGARADPSNYEYDKVQF